MQVTSRTHYMLIFTLPVLLALTSVGCSLSGLLKSNADESALSRPTRTPFPTFTPTPAGAAFVELPPTVTPLPPTATPPPPPAESAPVEQPQSPPPTPVPTDTPEAAGPVTVTILQDMNVRTGPGTNYPVAGPGPAGESSSVTGRNTDGSWLQVEYPLTDDGTGWVYAELVQVNGNPQTAPVVQVAAPPAVVAAPPKQEEPSEPPPTPAPQYQFTPGAWSATENAAICHFKGRIRDEGGNLVNGYSVYVTNDAWGTVSHPAGASVWYPDKGDGEWDVAGIGLNNCPGWWKLYVVKYQCDFNAGFNAECKDFSVLSEKIPVQLVYPDEMVINADWTCHWDCDKGVYSQGYRRN